MAVLRVRIREQNRCRLVHRLQGDEHMNERQKDQQVKLVGHVVGGQRRVVAYNRQRAFNVGIPLCKELEFKHSHEFLVEEDSTFRHPRVRGHDVAQYQY